MRRLVSDQPIQAGNVGYDWDGRDDHGQLVPNEAYFPKVALRTGGDSEILDPIALPALPTESPRIEYYDRQTGNFTYRLKNPSRVHIQAGQSHRAPNSDEPSGPVLRTIVDRLPRTSGKILEVWRGYSADGSLLIPELENFVMAVAAAPLPPYALITVGNETVTFFDYALGRRSEKDRQPRVPPAGARHHEFLSVFEDKSPDLSLRVAPCDWEDKLHVWSCPPGELDVGISMDEKQELYFRGIAANPILFVDGERLASAKVDSKTHEMFIPAGALKDGDHVVAVNWPTWNGPVGVGIARVRLGKVEANADSHARVIGNE